MADSYVDSQQEILTSSHSSLSSSVENVYRFANYWTPSSEALAGVYVRVAGNFADNVITMTRLVNNMMFANVEAYNTTSQHAADNSKELLKVGIDTAKTFEQISKNTI